MLEHYVPLPVSGIYYKAVPPALIPDTGCQMAINFDFNTYLGAVVRDGLKVILDSPTYNVLTALASFVKFNGDTKILAGDSNNIYSINPTNGNMSSLGTFNNSVNDPISYTTFTDKLLYVNKQNKLRSWDGVSTTQETVVDSYAARHVRTFGAYVLLLSTLEDGHDVPQRIRWSVPGDYEDWSGPGSGFLDLVDTPDPIMNGLMYGGSFVIYKRNSVIVLDLTGSTGSTFRVTSAYSKAGMVSYRGIVDLGDSHIFLGHDNFYQFTGSPHLEPIGDPIWQLVQEKADWSRITQSHAVHDIYNNKAVFYIPVKENYGDNSGWAAFNYDYKIGGWSYYEYPYESPASLYTLEYGNFLTQSYRLCKTSGEMFKDFDTSDIKAWWLSKRFNLEGDSAQAGKFTRFMGIEMEVPQGGFKGSGYIWKGDALDVFDFSLDPVVPIISLLPHVPIDSTVKSDFDVSGKYISFLISHDPFIWRASFKGFKIKYELGGI